MRTSHSLPSGNRSTHSGPTRYPWTHVSARTIPAPSTLVSLTTNRLPHRRETKALLHHRPHLQDRVVRARRNRSSGLPPSRRLRRVVLLSAPFPLGDPDRQVPLVRRRAQAPAPLPLLRHHDVLR